MHEIDDRGPLGQSTEISLRTFFTPRRNTVRTRVDRGEMDSKMYANSAEEETCDFI